MIYASKFARCALFALGLRTAVLLGQVQDPSGAVTTPLPAEPERSIEALNLIGSETAMPPFSESPIDLNSPFRQKLWSEGVALRGLMQLSYAQNTLQAPVPADEQVYVGQRPYQGAMTNWTLTSDLRQLHLKQAQFYICGVWDWVSWNPAGPKAFQIYGMYLYKAFGEDRVQIKAGYIGNNLEVIGLTVGGSAATGAQGVYAVLPFEVGLSYFPLTTPSFNIRVRGPRNTYVKAVSQRSLDPEGGPTEVERNHTGFRFIPHGDKLLLLGEVGYLRPEEPKVRGTWFRAGYMDNRTPFANLSTGKTESGNHAIFGLADYQMRQPSPTKPGQGLYIGGTAMGADSRFNAYSSYYELRLYQKAPFGSRPFDMASVVAYYTGHSSELTNSLVASGKTVWRTGASVTGSYALRVRSGQYLNAGLSYVHGPAVTPRVDSALTLSTNYTVFF
jgi:porin